MGKKKISFFGWLLNSLIGRIGSVKCSVCGRPCDEELEKISLKSQGTSLGSSLKGLILNDSITISEVHSGNDIAMLTYRLDSIKTSAYDKELWEVRYRGQKAIGKLKGSIRFAVSGTEQILTLTEILIINHFENSRNIL